MAKMLSERVREQLVHRIIDGELATAKRNKQEENSDFESYVDLLDSVREPKDYEWMSDLRIPEFVSHVLTQASIDANKYFVNRDFVEMYLEDEGDEAKAAAEAVSELINRTLNQRHLHYYQKYMRAKVMNNVAGRVYARCWWEKQVRVESAGEETSYDEAGNIVVTPKEKFRPVIDRFNFEVLDPRNVFTDNSYVYSLQQKRYVIIRGERTLEDLRRDSVEIDYFNLDKLEELLEKSQETETAEETYNSGVQTPKYGLDPDSVIKPFDLYERFGPFWCIVEERDENGNPFVVRPGIDDDGKVKQDAELVETIITFAKYGGTSIPIRFEATPYVDAEGNPYRPLLRGLCYIHITNDGGTGDGKHVREIQLAIDDTFNLSNDRVRLATLPTLLTKRFEAEDNPDIYIEPGHTIPLENIGDLRELEIKDNIGGAMQQLGMLFNKMQQLDATFPTTMGDMPGMASTTATAVAGAESRTDIRTNYKSLTFENTFLTDLYWMIMQMTWQFAHPETGTRLMGKKVFAFDPSKEYFSKPVSQAIETEYSKTNKIKLYIQILGYISAVQHPDAVKIFNLIMTNVFKLMGDEFVNFGDKLLNPKQPLQPPEVSEGQAAAQPGAPQMMPMTNQSGVPQTGMEQMVRGGMDEQGG